MQLEPILQWLQATPLADTIAENEIAFPWIEAVHVLAITLVVGTISIVDLRLLGIASRDRVVGPLMREVLPWTWGAFGVAALTGSLMFSSNAVRYAHNFYFRGKFIFLALAGLNMVIFHVLGRSIVRGDGAGNTPLTAKAAGAFSLLLWICVVAFGRDLALGTMQLHDRRAGARSIQQYAAGDAENFHDLRGALVRFLERHLSHRGGHRILAAKRRHPVQATHEPGKGLAHFAG